ncbi:hypothetical protein PUR49_06340 [Streptomyces sp. BE147]|uniref:hypothetical protein n=1 Tax=Streptomyces sp. BE147 TaxID=3002524 RepID=UPI002E792D02|nr:hypothetical protein [Streptomyces sp. BE147]MEE1736134.1 hypothetical protein [Streptomyces sp. BE147]
MGVREEALESAHKNMGDIFGLTSEQAWRHIGACPMYGTEGGSTWTLDDHKKLRKFADDNSIGCISGWNTNNDATGYEYGKVQKDYRPEK